MIFTSKRTVNGIVKSLEKTRKRLIRLGLQLDAVSVKKAKAASLLYDEADSHADEARRARSVADKFANLLA